MSSVKTGPSTPVKNKFRTPRLIIPQDIHRKIMFWVDEANFECSWLGTIDHDKESNTFYVVDVFLLKQENSSASTDLDQNEIARLLYEQRENPFDIKWWGHSHVKMDVFWSNTDIATMEILSDGGWFISTVFNQHRKMKTAFTQLDPLPVMIDNIETTVYDFLSEAERREWKEEFNSKVTNKSYSYKSSSTTAPSYYSQNQTPVVVQTPKNNIPPPANMPDWKQYATDKWKEGLHAAEAIEVIKEAKNVYKSAEEIMMEDDAGPLDDIGLYIAMQEHGNREESGERTLSPQEEEFLAELYEQYELARQSV